MARPTIYATMNEVVADFPDGVMLMIAGFGPGMAWNLLTALYEQGAADLTTVSNTIGYASHREDMKGLAELVQEGRVRKAIASFTTSSRPTHGSAGEDLVRAGEMEMEVVPQGTLAERIRAGGAGIPAFYTPAGIGTAIADGKEYREFDGRGYIMERALFADYALIRAWKADEAGNLIYRRAARNFNPIMAMAARCTIVEVEQPIVPAGALDPDQIHTPGVYVHRLVQITEDGIFGVDRRALVRAYQARAAGTPNPDTTP